MFHAEVGGAGPSSHADEPATPSSSNGYTGEDGNTSPIVMAVPLPCDDVGENEEWWHLKMSWSGKVFEMKVGGSDM